MSNQGNKCLLQFDARLNEEWVYYRWLIKNISESSGKGIYRSHSHRRYKESNAKKSLSVYRFLCLWHSGCNFDVLIYNLRAINVDVEFDSKVFTCYNLKRFTRKMNDGDFVLIFTTVWHWYTWNNGVYKWKFRNISLNMKDCTVYQPGVYSICLTQTLSFWRGNYDAPKLTGKRNYQGGTVYRVHFRPDTKFTFCKRDRRQGTTELSYSSGILSLTLTWLEEAWA